MGGKSDLTYNMPARLAGGYRGKPVILRTADPAVLVDLLDEKDLDRLVSLQLTDLDCDITLFQQYGHGMPLELMVTDPETEFSKLYAFSSLVESFPIRANVSLLPGFEKAVRVAAALHFAVKLDVGQPDVSMIPELMKTLDFYLHSPGVTEPVEFFHSLLLACCHDQSISLWAVQEEDPLLIRHVDAEGKESFPGRLAGCSTLPEDPAAHPDCRACSYLDPCAGYFKWPDHGYDCGGIVEIFAHIKGAGLQLRADIAAMETIVP